MNRRLYHQYLSLEERSKDRFLNNDVEIDTLSGKSIWGIALQICPGAAVKDQIFSYQGALGKLEPGNLFLLPRRHLHITFNQVVFWGDQYLSGAQQTWDTISSGFIAEFKKLDGKFPSFTINFSKLLALSKLCVDFSKALLRKHFLGL